MVSVLAREDPAKITATTPVNGYKKTDEGQGPLRLAPDEQHVPCGQQYAVGVVQRFMAMVLHCGG
jgi:hypothetical protein